jgi:hypothetical protein
MIGPSTVSRLVSEPVELQGPGIIFVPFQLPSAFPPLSTIAKATVDVVCLIAGVSTPPGFQPLQGFTTGLGQP